MLKTVIIGGSRMLYEKLQEIYTNSPRIPSTIIITIIIVIVIVLLITLLL